LQLHTAQLHTVACWCSSFITTPTFPKPLPEGATELQHKFQVNYERIRQRMVAHTTLLVDSLERRFPGYGTDFCFSGFYP
jgi:hypothetical protein